MIQAQQLGLHQLFIYKIVLYFLLCNDICRYGLSPCSSQLGISSSYWRCSARGSGDRQGPDLQRLFAG